MHLYFFMVHKKAGAFYCHTYAIRPRPIAVRPRSILKRIIDFSVAMNAFYSLFFSNILHRRKIRLNDEWQASIN